MKLKRRYFIKTGITAIVLTATMLQMGIYANEDVEKSSTAPSAKKSKSPEEDAVYGIGSISKMYVATAIMQLKEEGKLDLDEPVTSYIPDFTMADERYKQITVRMLLNHTSGLMGSSFSNNILYEDNDPVAHDQLLEHLKRQRLKADPGKYGTYCNDGFVLAEILVERVSGESFTEYLEKHIFKPLGAQYSGTALNRINAPGQVPTYFDDSILYATEYCNVFGAGGVISTAEEVCRFGQTFMKDNNQLLSSASIEEMAQPAETSYGYVTDGSWDHYGLGWDSVDAAPFNEYGIKALIKGGDLLSQHGMLMVMPDENVSVAVLSSGGSSTFNALLAQELAKVTLEEKGALIEAELNKEKKILSISEEDESAIQKQVVPEKYKEYEGVYATNTGFYRVSFPDKEGLRIEECDTEIPKVQDYIYTKDGGFVSKGEKYIGENGLANADGTEFGKTKLSFKTEKDGKQYICVDSTLNYAEIGSSKMSCMFAEKVSDHKVSFAAMKAWKERDGKKYYLTSEKYSSAFWNLNPVIKLKLSTQAEGYVNASGRMTTTKITGENEAKAFVTLTGGVGRDLNDISFKKQAENDGEAKEKLILENIGLQYMEESEIPDLDLSQNKIKFSQRGAKWYKVTPQLAKNRVVLKPSEHMATYIYNQYDECIYSTYMKNLGNEAILPENGKIVVIGEAGSQLELSKK